MRSIAAQIAIFLLSSAYAQQMGTQTAEVHPSLTLRKCVYPTGCADESAELVLDANFRLAHDANGNDCLDGPHDWNLNVCMTPTQCAAICQLEGVDYQGQVGVSTSTGLPSYQYYRNAAHLNFVTPGPWFTNVGSRVFVAHTNMPQYKLFTLKNQEIAFDVDVSMLPCGVAASLYLVEMDADGGKAKYTGNKAGAKYGTGYCDASCRRDTRWINGEVR